MIVVNLFGGPGTGKSTTAAMVFSKLKSMGVKCEYATEYAKDATYREMSKVLKDQLYILAKQHHKLWIVKDVVDIVITDSPLLNGLTYLDPNDTSILNEKFISYTNELVNQYDNLNIFLHRSNFHPYQQYGRTQSFETACQKDLEILSVLEKYNHNYYNVDVNESTADTIVDIIMLTNTLSR